MYLDGLREGSAVVHLPSYCKVYNSRVYEGMAAGRPVITSRGSGRPRLDGIFEEGKDLLTYSADDPQALAKHIRSILDNPECGHAIALRARDKLLRFHTTEMRVRQILDWIATGQEPCYNAADYKDVAAAKKKRDSDMRSLQPSPRNATRFAGKAASRAARKNGWPCRGLETENCGSCSSARPMPGSWAWETAASLSASVPWARCCRPTAMTSRFTTPTSTAA